MAAEQLLTQLRFLTGDQTLDDETGTFCLEMCEGNVEQAARFYRDQKQAAAVAALPPPPLAAAAAAMPLNSSHSASTTSGSLGTSRRRTSVATRLPPEPTVRRVEPGPAGGYEPGGGLVTGRRNRGFANNVDLLGNAAEFEFLHGNSSRSSFHTAPASPYSHKQIADVYGFSSPGAFNEYQDGEEGFVARERREAAAVPIPSGSSNSSSSRYRHSSSRRASAINPTTEPMPGGDQKNLAPRRTRTAEGNIPSQKSDGSSMNYSHSSSSPSASASATTPVGQLKKPPPSALSPSDENTGGLKKPPPTSSRLEENSMQDSWTGKQIIGGKSPQDSSAWLSSELGDSDATLMTFAEGDLDIGASMTNSSGMNSSSSRRRPSARNYAIEPAAKPSTNNRKEEDQMEMLQAMQRGMIEDTSITAHFYDNGDNSVPRLSGTTCSTSSLSASAKRDSVSHRGSSTALLTPTELPVLEEAETSASSAVASVSTAASPVAAVAKPSRPDPPGETIDTPWLYIPTGRTPPGSPKKDEKDKAHEEDDEDEGAKKPAAKPTQQSTSKNAKKDGKVKRAPAMLPGAVSVGIMASEPGQPNEHQREPSLSPVFVPRRQVNDESSSSLPLVPQMSPKNKKGQQVDDRNQTSSSSLPLTPQKSPKSKKGKDAKVRRAPATIPGAVNVSGEEPSNHDSLGDSHNSASSFPSPEPDSKIRRAPASKPGAVNVTSKNEVPTRKAKDLVSRHITHPGENGAAERASNISPKRDGKAVRHARAVVPGAVSVAAEEPGADSSTNVQQEQQTQQIAAPSGKVRHRKATQPGAVGVSGAEPSNKKDGKASAGLRKSSSKPGAVNVAGDDEAQEEGEKQKSSGLRRKKTLPGAVNVSGTSDQETDEQNKTSRFRLGPKPEEVVVQITNSSSNSSGDSKSDEKKDGKGDKKVQGNLKPMKPGAVSVTSSEAEEDVRTGVLAATETAEPAIDQGAEVLVESEQPNVELDCDDDPDPSEQMHLARLAHTRERMPLLPFPTRPDNAHIKPKRHTRNQSPNRVVSDPTRGFLDLAVLPPVPPKNRRTSDGTQTSKKDKKGRLFGLFKKKDKDKKLITDEDVGFQEDDVILAREGNSRPFSRLPTK